MSAFVRVFITVILDWLFNKLVESFKKYRKKRQERKKLRKANRDAISKRDPRILERALSDELHDDSKEERGSKVHAPIGDEADV